MKNLMVWQGGKGEAWLGKVKPRLWAGLREFVESDIAPGV